MANEVYRFHLNGLDYTLRGDKSVADMEKIVAAVEEKIEVINKMAPGYSAMRAATLAAIQLSEELLEAKRENAALMAEVNLGPEQDLFHQPIQKPRRGRPKSSDKGENA